MRSSLGNLQGVFEVKRFQRLRSVMTSHGINTIRLSSQLTLVSHMPLSSEVPFWAVQGFVKKVVLLETAIHPRRNKLPRHFACSSL